jgi:Flp pilus assembly protein TadD
MFAKPGYKVSVRSVLLALSSFCLLGPVSAQMVRTDSGDAGTGGTHTIVGSVYSPSGQRVDKLIRVRLNTMTRGDMTTMTDDKGEFTFRRLVPGSYTIVIDGEKEFEPVSQQVDIIQPNRGPGSSGQTYMVQLRLRLRGVSAVKPGVLSADFANVPARAVAFYEKALEQAQAGKNKVAIEQLKQAVSQYSGFMLAFNELGVQYLRVGELEKADEALRSALKISPDAFAPLMNHGIVLVLLKQFKEAEPELRRALITKEQSPVGHYYLGRALAYLGRFEEAEMELNRAVTLGGDEVKEAHRYLAGIHNNRGDSVRAIAELETYLRLAPTSPDAEHIRQLIRQLRGSAPAKANP